MWPKGGFLKIISDARATTSNTIEVSVLRNRLPKADVTVSTLTLP